GSGGCDGLHLLGEHAAHPLAPRAPSKGAQAPSGPRRSSLPGAPTTARAGTSNGRLRDDNRRMTSLGFDDGRDRSQTGAAHMLSHWWNAAGV
ncbi:MAG TPA: hypothetical protein PKJ12_11425, partial [Ottowia sp.]|nr:hypothetical protein [Ottowia sp.]